MDNCELTISTELSVQFPEITWRLDTNIPAPGLFLPTDARVFCLAADGGNSRVCLQWFPVAAATHYLVQWALDDGFSGPSLREAIVSAPNITYCLGFQDEIRQGETVFWRVQAANLVTGGISLKSPLRRFTYNCGEGNNQMTPTKCDEYDVKAVVKGKNFMSCCEYGTFWLELSYGCQDAFGNPLVQLTGVEWGINGDNAAEIVNQGDGIFAKTGVKTCSKETQVFEVTAKLTFQDKFLDTFECDAEPFAVLADCGDITDPTFYVTLREKFRDSKKGTLKNCGEEVFVKNDCIDCFPCCNNFNYNAVNTFPYGVAIYDNVRFNPDTCILEYDLLLNVDAQDHDLYLEVLKGDGKSTKTPPNQSETDFAWTYFLPANVAGQISLSYRGCWRFSDVPFFQINSELQEPTKVSNEHIVGRYVTCLSTPLCDGLPEKRNTEFAVVGGPVFSVDDFECSSDLWPTCTDEECDCDYGRLKVTYNNNAIQLVPGNTYRFDLDCECEECKEGFLTASLIESDIFPDCSEITHTVRIQVFCDRRLTFSDNVSIDFSCVTKETKQLATTYCGCVFKFLAENMLGTYTQEGLQCNCIPQKMSVCLEADNELACIEDIEWKNGQWLIPSNNYLETEEGVYYLAKLEFVGCNLTADICKINKECLPCGPFPCFCVSGCRQIPKTVNSEILFTLAGSPPVSVPVTFTMDCERQGYISSQIVIPSATGCNSSGFLFIDGNTITFEGVDSNLAPISAISSNYTVSCTNGISATLDIDNVCYQDGVAEESETVLLAITTTEDAQDCGDCYLETITFNIEQCEPLIASATTELNLSEVRVTIGKEDLLSRCGCKIPTAQEARVNIPLGCGLTVAEDTGIPGQKTIAVDAEALAGLGKDSSSLDVSYKEGCAHLTLPICACVGFRPGPGLTFPGPTKIIRPHRNAYLYKGFEYKCRALFNIKRSEFGFLEVLDYARVNPGFRPEITAKNQTGEIIVAGQVVILTVTDGCELIITSVEHFPPEIPNIDLDVDTSVDAEIPVVDGEYLPLDCEGSCKWIWDNTLKKWFLDESESDCRNYEPPTTTPPTTADPGTTTPDPRVCFEEENKGYCVLTCVDETGNGVGAWRYLGRFDGANPGFACNPFEEFIACTEIGETKCVPPIPLEEVPTSDPPTTEPPEEGCTYECINGYWELINENCPDGHICDDSILELWCSESQGTTLAPCIDPEGCGCVYPNFCGDEDGQCTYTACIKNPESFIEIECEDPGSPTTSPPSTTDPPGEPGDVLCCKDAVVTSTTRENCCDIGGVIVYSEDDCGEIYGGDCGVPCIFELRGLETGRPYYEHVNRAESCVPVRPGVEWEDCVNCRCTIPLPELILNCPAPTDCPDLPATRTSPCLWNCPPTPEPEPCDITKQCTWYGGCGIGWWWTPLFAGCVPTFDSRQGCNCPPPSFEPPADSIICTFTFCQETKPGTSGGGTPGGPDWEDPCKPTPTTSPPPTTVPPACEGECFWITLVDGENLYWDLKDSDCSSGCVCQDPGRPPLEDCDTIRTFCVSDVQPTTSPPPPTTAAPTTAAPTTSPPTTDGPFLGSCCDLQGNCTNNVAEEDCFGACPGDSGVWSPLPCHERKDECPIIDPESTCCDTEGQCFVIIGCDCPPGSVKVSVMGCEGFSCPSVTAPPPPP